MGDDGPREGEVNQATIEVTGPISKEEWEAYKKAIKECLDRFKKYDPRIVKISYEKRGGGTSS
jgi:hypothetical protein